ncbi:hypothetical protein [Geoglobus acetivorans]|uniref:KaiC-like domain-containing protein n=1 Tax=Geoglobus acetivorans TaxID=565033 RepID=A0ABZ3H7A5_GEOAI|nr:hypothetical protein [Geoglobus acetivorans]
MFRTGIEIIDRFGGLNEGLNYIIEEPGAGGEEFAYYLLMKNTDKNLKIISISESEEEILKELEMNLSNENFDRIAKKLQIVSLDRFYFKGTCIPVRWVLGKEPDLEDLKGEGDLLSELANQVDAIEENTVLVLNSLTDLLRIPGKYDVGDILAMIHGLRKIALRKNVLVLILMTKGVISEQYQNLFLSISDGIMFFEWSKQGSMERWLYFRKLSGLLPHLERENITRMKIRFDPVAGFMVTQYERVL